MLFQQHLSYAICLNILIYKQGKKTFWVIEGKECYMIGKLVIETILL